jgi:predicted acyltransferase
LALGSALPIIALLIATLYYRFVEPAPSLPDELALVLASVVLLVTGYSWQLRAPTIAGCTE